jgi:hypothetical protein
LTASAPHLGHCISGSTPRNGFVSQIIYGPQEVENPCVKRDPEYNEGCRDHRYPYREDKGGLKLQREIVHREPNDPPLEIRRGGAKEISQSRTDP